MLCCVLLWFGTGQFYQYSSGLLHWHSGNHMHMTLCKVKQPWQIRVNTSPEATRNSWQNKTKHNKSFGYLMGCKTKHNKSFAYLMGCTLVNEQPVEENVDFTVEIRCICTLITCCQTAVTRIEMLDEIFITGYTGNCQYGNFQCSQWWKFHQNDISANAVSL